MGFKPTTSTVERPQTYALDHVATGSMNTNTNKILLNNAVNL